ncbi:MAG: ATP-binding protein [Elusimicrobiota bacterium]|nr:MAG: ATP-binding protein [Elusimicrobiota bacterium]
MTKSEFEELVEELRSRGSELEDVEVKEASGGTPTRVWESLSALANRSGGGTLLFGFSEKDFTWIGVKDADELQKVVGQACAEMEPPVRPRMDLFTEKGRRALVVRIPECARDHKPCYYKPSGLPGAHSSVSGTATEG